MVVTGAHRRARRVRVAAVLCAALVGAGSGGATAAFTATTSTSPGAFSSAAADTTAPAVARTAVVREVPTGSAVAVTTNRYRQNGAYRVYAQVTDASGVGAVTADTSTVGGGTATTPMTAGSYTAAGQTYNYASAVLTAGDVAATGASRAYSVAGTDTAGNTTTAPGTATTETYAQALAATPALVGHWPLQSSTPVTTSIGTDDFTGTDGEDIGLGRVSTDGLLWSDMAFSGTFAQITGNRVRQESDGYALLYTVAPPSTGDYTVEADVVVATLLAGTRTGVAGRIDNPGGNVQSYTAQYDTSASAWVLARCFEFTTCTTLGSFPQALTAGPTYRLGLQMTGSTLRLTVNGTTRVTATDATYTSGDPGIALGVPTGGGGSPTDATGLRLDNYAVTAVEPTTASTAGAGAPSGRITGGAALGAAGAIADDTGTALALDGSDDSVRVPRNTGNGHVVKDDYSLEAWFRTSAGRGAGTQWHTGKGVIDATGPDDTQNNFGVSLDSAGRVTGGSGGHGGVWASTTLQSPASPISTDGAWHHVVLTRVRATGAMVLYVDGQPVSTGTGGTSSHTSGAALAFGTIADPDLFNRYLAGAVDEVAVYSGAVSAGSVLDHYRAGRGTG